MYKITERILADDITKLETVLAVFVVVVIDSVGSGRRHKLTCITNLHIGFCQHKSIYYNSL